MTHVQFRAAVWKLRMSVALMVLLVTAATSSASGAPSYAQQIAAVQPKIVKIYGAGGFKRLEAYQSGFLVSADGLVLTAWSYVLDTDYITVTLNDGRKYQAAVKGYDPRIEIALLKIDAVNLPYFNLDASVELESGDRVLAFSNLYGVATGDEPASVLHGQVSARTTLAARRSTFATPYRGTVYVLDAMTNNPGAAGGALTDRLGNLAGILGKELRNSQSNVWINYAIPIHELAASIDAIRSGKLITRRETDEDAKSADPLTMPMLGITLVPDVLNKTPPFIDRVQEGSAAARAGLKVDDLILFVNDRVATSCKAIQDELSYIDRDDAIRLLVQRGQELLDIELSAVAP